MNVQIIRIKQTNGGAGIGTTCGVEVIVDGRKIGGGWFGGEPEDNYEFRRYRWVVPLLKKLALELDAVVEETARDAEE